MSGLVGDRGELGAIDFRGLYLILACIGTLIMYGSLCIGTRFFRSRNRMGVVAAGRIRIAAARGDIDTLDNLSKITKYFQCDATLGGFTALHAAACSKQPGAILWLCQHGANVSAVKDDEWKDTALHYAAAQGCVESIQVLLAYGADPNAKNFASHSPADVAKTHDHSLVVDYFEKLCPENYPNKKDFEGQFYVKTNGLWTLQNDYPFSKANKRDDPLKPSFDGIGTQGTVPSTPLSLFRPLAVITQILHASYLIWRALRTFLPSFGFIYSAVFWLAEVFSFSLGNIFMLSLWNRIERPERKLYEMIQVENFPHVDVYITCYNEPVEVIEASTIAAMNLEYPGEKLYVRVLDDGKRSSIHDMVKRLQSQARYMNRKTRVLECVRDKVKGTPHHAKAGNINNCLLKGSSDSDAEFILVLDCDMILHPDFLLKTLGHFYVEENGQWSLKDFAAFLQTPQDFWNVDATDSLVHCARFFYGPMLQGRDGIGACPCCGTGVLFRKDILVSIGGQAHGSITEDYNTAMCLLASGFSTMFLNTRLAYGMAPDDIISVFRQRLRWAMGGLQILFNDNPLKKLGLNFYQSVLFYEATAFHLLAFGTILMALVPIVYVFSMISPLVSEQLWEFSIVFGIWYLFNRITMFVVHRECEGSNQELWRGSQLWVWMAPNHCKAILKVIFSELSNFWCVNFEINFVVTNKDSSSGVTLLSSLSVLWPFLVYILSYIVSFIYFIVTSSLGWYSASEIVIFLSALAWGTLVCICIWPPVSTILPRVETEEGWKITWHGFFDDGRFTTDSRGRLIRINRDSLHSKKEYSTGNHLKLKTDNGEKTESHQSPGDLESQSTCNIDSFRLFEQPMIDIGESPFQYSSSESDFEVVVQRSQENDNSQNETWKGGFMDAFHMTPSSTQENPSLRNQIRENFGRVSLPRHTAQGLSASAFITSMVLPEPLETKDPQLKYSHNCHLVSWQPTGSLSPAEHYYPKDNCVYASSETDIYKALQNRTKDAQLSKVLQFGQEIAALSGNLKTQEAALKLQIKKDIKSNQVYLFNSISIPSGDNRTNDTVHKTANNELSSNASIRLKVLLEQLRISQREFQLTGTSFILPVVPRNIYEYSIAARPNFDDRQVPKGNFMFIIVNGMLLIGLIVGSLLEVFLEK